MLNVKRADSHLTFSIQYSTFSIMKTTLLFFLALTIILITSTMLFAQPPVPMGPAQAPIDGGLGLLAAAGGSYALKKLRDKKKAEEEVEI